MGYLCMRGIVDRCSMHRFALHSVGEDDYAVQWPRRGSSVAVSLSQPRPSLHFDRCKGEIVMPNGRVYERGRQSRWRSHADVYSHYSSMNLSYHHGLAR